MKQIPQKLYYLAWRQDKDVREMAFYIRTALPSAQTVPQIRRVMTSIDRDLPLETLRTLDAQIAQNISTDRLVMQLSAAFAILAMLGLYGVMVHKRNPPYARDRHPNGARYSSRQHPPNGPARDGMDRRYRF